MIVQLIKIPRAEIQKFNMLHGKALSWQTHWDHSNEIFSTFYEQPINIRQKKMRLMTNTKHINVKWSLHLLTQWSHMPGFEVQFILFLTVTTSIVVHSTQVFVKLGFINMTQALRGYILSFQILISWTTEKTFLPCWSDQKA